MPFWRAKAAGPLSLDEFIGDGDARAASPLDLRPGHGDWQKALAKLSGEAPKTARELALPAFSLVRGGDLFESPRGKSRRSTGSELLDLYLSKRLKVRANGLKGEVVDAAVQGVLRVLAGNPAVCKRMLITRPIQLVLVPKGKDFRSYGFPPSTNPRAAGIFWNNKDDAEAMLGLREERILEKPWLMIHEMAHAVHLMGFTEKERGEIDRMLMPVYRSQRWVEEAVAIYAECAFGAKYTEDDYRAPGLYGKTRRDWDSQHVFSLFSAELFRPLK